MRILSILLLLFASVSFGADELMSNDIELTAPETCVIGELVVLDASASSSEKLVWKIKPATDDFKVFDKQACFSGRSPGTFLVIIAGVNAGEPVLKTHEIVVEGSSIVPTGLSAKMKEWAKSVSSEKKAEEALKFAQSFRALAGAQIPIDKMLASTADANKRALGDSLDAWKPFLDRLGLYLDGLAAEGKLKTPDDYKQTWLDLADSIEGCFK